MKRFILKITIFFLLIAVTDFCFGQFCNFLYNNAGGGEAQNQKHILHNENADILIMGSSRARHHYAPQILEETLGMSVYNCGLDGNGIIYQYGLLRLILERHTPKIIIYDATANFDIRQNDNKKYLNNLRKYFNDPIIDSLFYDIAPNNYIKMYSNLYRYNWTFLTFIRDFISKTSATKSKGFEEIHSVMNYEPTPSPPKINAWDETKKKYFKKFVDICQEKGITLIITFSPFYNGANYKELEPIESYCLKHNIPLFNFFNEPAISKDRAFFADSYHLNSKGAKLFSLIFSERLKRTITLVND